MTATELQGFTEHAKAKDDRRAGCTPRTGSGTRWRTIHMGQSVRGALLRWQSIDWQRATEWITRDDGSKYTATELKEAFLDELAKGHEVLPMSPCNNWDWKTGCKGCPPQNNQTEQRP